MEILGRKNNFISFSIILPYYILIPQALACIEVPRLNWLTHLELCHRNPEALEMVRHNVEPV